jgi:hypothetical protein
MIRRSAATAAMAVVCGALLLGCATREGFERRMGAYVGRSEVDLVAALGVPARTYQVDNRRFLQYERRRVLAESYPGWGWRWAGGVSVQTLDCSTTFEIADGRVEGFTSRGNDCLATTPS